MEYLPADKLLVSELRSALRAMSSTSPNYGPVIEALRCAEASRKLTAKPIDRERRLQLLRLSAGHLRLASARTACSAENYALESARRAMTAALFECSQQQRPAAYEGARPGAHSRAERLPRWESIKRPSR
jgi:hypothetical protein